MPRRARELAVALTALALVGCTASPHSAPSASPVPSPSTSSPTPAPTPTPTERTYVLGVLGDYGVDGPPAREVVRAMGRFAPRLDAVVTTGDNAYCCGAAIEAAVARSLLAPLHTKVYAALGNHDEMTGGGQPVMKAFGLTARWYTAVVGPVELVVLDANRARDPTQLAFLRTTLAAPRRTAFRVVAFHQPGWSCSLHDADPGVIARWMPLFRKTAVDLVLAGHNHTYERFAGRDGVPYVTTGGGGATLYPSVRSTCRGAGKVVTTKTVHHALRITATRGELTVEAIGTDGTTFDRFSIRHFSAP